MFSGSRERKGSLTAITGKLIKRLSITDHRHKPPAFIATTSSPDTLTEENVINNIIFEGELMKKGKIHKAWKSRYCILNIIREGEIVLEYYESKKNRRLCGTIDLCDVFAIEVISEYRLSLSSKLPENIIINAEVKTDRPHTFQITTAKRKFLFAAPDRAEFDEWLTSLDKYIYRGIVKEGWLWKKGQQNKGWKRRYFVLNEFKQIKYYEDEHDLHSKYKGTIRLNEILAITNGKVYSDEYKYTLRLITEKRIWILCAKDLKERGEWHQLIKKERGPEKLSQLLASPSLKGITPDIADLQRLSRLKYLPNGRLAQFNSSDLEQAENVESTNEVAMQYANCQNVRKCKALSRITMNLHFYQTVIEGDQDPEGLLLNYCQQPAQKHILNDYCHLLQFHLNQPNRTKSNEQYQIIHDSVSKYIRCNLECCSKFKRLYRDRMRSSEVPNEDHTVSFYMDLLDTIHCTFVHQYDTGNRINTAQLSPRSSAQYSFNQDNLYADDDGVDEETNYIHSLLALKRKKLKSTDRDGTQRWVRNRKYTTLISESNRKRLQSENKEAEDDPMTRLQRIGTVMILPDEVRWFEDDYHRGEPIGTAGTFGITYSCYKKTDENQTMLAVKQISKAKFYQIEQEARLELMQNMKNEIEVMRLLKHENIVKLHEVYEDKNFIYLVMDYLKGGELFQRISGEESMSEKNAANYTRQILEALSYMQSNNICHFDLKPDNIMFDHQGPDATLKLIDFGMAQVVPRLKELQQIVGTPYYTAPEILDGAYDRAADVWSVGVIVFCMLFGFPPFWVDEDALNAGKDHEKRIFELIKKGFMAEVRDGYGPWFPAEIPVSEDAMNIIGGMLQYKVADRLTVSECLDHPWIRGGANDESLPKTVISSLSNFRGTCKFKLLVSKMFAKKIDPATYQRTLQVFKKWDVDGDGEITLEEFKKGMMETTDMNEEQITEIFQNLDADESRAITIDELVVSAAFNALVSVDQRMYEAFNELDQNGDGKIELAELKQVLESLDEAKEIDNIDEVIQEIDVNGDGEIDVE